MNRKQEARFGMMLTTVDYCEPRASLTAPLPGFSTNLTTVKTTCGKIHLTVEAQAANTSGTTVAKNDLRVELATRAADTSRKLMAFARLSKNQKLLKEISYAESELMRLPDTILADTSQLIYDRAQAHLSSLADYLVTDETQAALQQAIDAYKVSLASPRLEQVNQSQIARQLTELFATADEALLNMDAVVEIVRLTEPDFYGGYKSARKIIDTGNRKMALKATVADAQSGEPLKGVTVSFWTNGDATKTLAADQPATLVKKTAAKGGFYVKTMPTGSYHASLKKAGYAEQSLTVYINDGELTLMDVKLEQL